VADLKISGLTALTAHTLAVGDKVAIDDISATASRSVLSSDIGFYINQGLGIFNVKDYGALGDNSTDDRAAIQTAHDAVGTAGGGILYFPPGTYIIGGAGISNAGGSNNFIWRGAGMKLSVLKAAASGQTGTTFINCGFQQNFVFEDLGFNSNNQTGHTVAISNSTNDTSVHNMIVNRCWFTGWRAAGTPAPGGAGHGAIYDWRSNALRVTNCEIEDCEYGVYAAEAGGSVLIDGNRIVNVADRRMVQGILIGSSILVTGGVRVVNNYVEGANSDPQANGANAFAISIFLTPGAIVSNNTTKNNGATVAPNAYVVGGGILMSGSAWGAVISNNSSITDVNGIYIEGDGASITIGAGGERRGANVTGNSIYGSYNAGMDISYSAGAQVIGNSIVETGGDGLVCDSDYVTMTANLIMNPYKAFSNPPQLDRSAIRMYAGAFNHLNNNTVIINPGTLPTVVTGLTRAVSGTGLTGTFFWKVVALNAWGEGPAAETTSITLSSQGCKLDWSAVAGATGYRIYRGTASNAETFQTNLGNVLTFTDNGTITPNAVPYTGKYYGIAFDSSKGHVVTGNTVYNVTAGNEYLVANNSTSSIRGDNSPNYINDDRDIALAADATANSTTTGVKITGLDATILPGTWRFEYYIRYQSAATTTGVKFGVNHTGTAAVFVADMRYAGGSTSATGAASQAAAGATGDVHESFSTRTKSTTAPNLGPTVSVDTANADMLVIVEGVMIVTAVGDIQLWHASEVAAASTVKAGSMVRLFRVGQ
jgi:hypothetical protein